MGVEDALAALGVLRHRGPDGQGHHVLADGNGLLGHQRLAIIDLSPAGAQPMTNEDGTLWLTFNGEIYNHGGLQAELEAKGHTFKGRCDAEVILHLYEEKGMDLLDDLRGMFAFGLYDTTKRTLFLARDRLGIKPLFVYEDGARCVFASELKAIRAMAGLDLAPDPTAYYDFLTYQYVPAPKTVYAKARKLPAGHWMEWKDGESRVRRWWDPRNAPEWTGTEEEAVEHLAGLLAESVEAHLVSDVPVGLFLSAGVDSSLVSFLAKEVSGEAHAAFTVRFEGREDDEADDAADIARRLGSTHHVDAFGNDQLVATIARMPELFDEPFADASALPMVGLCELAARHGKVVLSGDGGDETHAGYGRYLKRDKRQSIYAVARSIPGLSGLARVGNLPAVPWVRAIRESALGAPYSFHMGLPREAKRLLIDFGDATFEDYDDYWAVREYEADLGTLRGQQCMDLATSLPEGILTKVDRTSMACGLEVRPPLLDHRVVEFALGLPASFKIREGEQKPLLRRLLARHLPPSISAAKKRAFSVPMKNFVRDGTVGLRGDLEVLDSFRVKRDALGRYFGPSRDYQVHWMLHALQGFLAAQEARV